MENKKRKEEEESDDGGDDEEKMDKFYSLLRSFREARDRRRKELDQKIRKTEIPNSSSPLSIWVPSFESGDFTNDVEFIRPPLIFPSPLTSAATTPPSDKLRGNNKDQHHQNDATLDLNLAL